MRDIARQCFISDAAVFYHFPEKRDILHALMSQDIELPAAPGVIGAPHEASLSQRIVDEAMRIVAQNHDLMRIVMGQGLAGDDQSRARYQDWTEFWEGRLAPVIAGESPLGAEESRLVARQIVLLVIMSFEDRMLLRRDNGMCAAERRSDLREFLVRSTERLLGS